MFCWRWAMGNSTTIGLLISATTLAIDTTALLFSLFHLNKFLSENATHPKKVITHRCQNNHLILTPLVSFIIMTSIPSDIKLPPSDVKQTIDKTVGYVIKMENLLKNDY